MPAVPDSAFEQHVFPENKPTGPGPLAYEHFDISPAMFGGQLHDKYAIYNVIAT
jgi:hypothetical protein